MFWFRHLLLHFWFLGCLYSAIQAWNIYMPRHIKGLLDSCLVIPCSFDYYLYPPERADRVVWYQYVSRGYPLVYDNWYPNDVISMYSGRTNVYTSKSKKTCTLKIERVNWDDHRQKLYPWVDPENVGRSTYAFYETTVTIEVVEQPEPPQITIFGERKVGNSVTVQCSAKHTCSTRPPTLSLNIAMTDKVVTNTDLSDGSSETTLEVTLVLKRDFQVIKCTAQHPGGKTARTSETLTAQCSIFPPSISSMSTEYLEGVPSQVTCEASYTCSKDAPVITWNYANMPVTTNIKTSGSLQKSVSTLTFTASAKDDGKDLICSTKFPGRHTLEKSMTIRVKRNMLNLDWSFTTPGSVTGMKGSCVIIPCKFSYSKAQPGGLQVVWYLYQSNGRADVFNQKQSNILSRYKGITHLTGSVSDSNCSLKIDRLDMSHNEDRLYPWVDINPITSYHSQGHSFLDKSTKIMVSEYVPVEEEQNEKDTFRVQAADVPVRFSALTRSCVVIPCSFQNDEDQPLTRGIWYKKTGGMVYHNARSNVLDHFKDRTKILGNLNEGDCSLEIDDIKPFDNGPFCFYGEKGARKYRFNNSCVIIDMKASPEKPVMSSVPAQVDAGSIVTVSCSVSHSCSSHPPTFSWSVPSINNEVSDTAISRGVWKTTSTITFLVAGGDGLRNLNCTATFWRGRNQTRTFNLIVEGTMKYQMQISIPVVIPVIILVLIIFAVLGIFFYRKRSGFLRQTSQQTALSVTKE